MKFIDKFYNVSIYETSYLGIGYNSAGLCLPGIGIFIGKDTYGVDREVVKHEYGHVLQAQKVGYILFYLFIGIPSLISAWTRGYGKGHQNYWTETWCNYLAKEFFCDTTWHERRFPSRALPKNRLKWLRMFIDIG